MYKWTYIHIQIHKCKSRAFFQNFEKNSVGYYINNQITKVFDQMQSRISFTENIMPVGDKFQGSSAGNLKSPWGD